MKKSVILAIVISIFVIAAIGFFASNIAKQTIFVTELGWIPFSTLDNQFSKLDMKSGEDSNNYYIFKNDLNQVIVTKKGCSCACQSAYHDSEFWYVSASSAGYCDSNPSNKVIGGDSNIQVLYPFTLTFKPDLTNANFKIDYNAYFPDGCFYSNNMVANQERSSITFSFADQYIGSVKCGTKGLFELKPSVLDDTKVQAYINGQLIKEVTYKISNNNLVIGGEGIILSNPRWKPQFDCNISGDEVLIFDEFAANSLVNVSSLTYPIKKFCINQPVIIRSLTSNGIATDTSNEILLRLSEGRNVQVKADQTMRIPYITKIQTGLLRCPLNSAFNTKTNSCENFLTEPTEDISSVYINPINIGSSEIGYTKTYNSNSPIVIGDRIIQTQAASYTCPCIYEGRISPSENPECWQIIVNNTNIKSKTTYKINDYLSLYYETQGNGVFNGIKIRDGIEKSYTCTYTDDSDWINVFKLSINKDGLLITSKPSIKTLELNKQTYLDVEVKNLISSFQLSGFRIRTINNIIDSVSEKDINIPLGYGIRNYSIPITTELLGNVAFEIIPYVEIENQKFFGNSKLTYSYVPKNETTIINRDCKNLGCPSDAICQDNGICLKTETKIEIQTEVKETKTFNYKIFGIIFGTVLIIVFIWWLLRAYIFKK